jgi:hypothetical protein
MGNAAKHIQQDPELLFHAKMLLIAWPIQQALELDRQRRALSAG